jgi:hypothetical protein
MGPAEHAVIADPRLYAWTLGVDFAQKSNPECTSITSPNEAVTRYSRIRTSIDKGGGLIPQGGDDAPHLLRRACYWLTRSHGCSPEPLFLGFPTLRRGGGAEREIPRITAATNSC